MTEPAAASLFFHRSDRAELRSSPKCDSGGRLSLLAILLMLRDANKNKQKGSDAEVDLGRYASGDRDAGFGRQLYGELAGDKAGREHSDGTGLRPLQGRQQIAG